ncbi:hypothetical protein C8A05DRAFT_37329 [Staphylotrichum tortipilum]|uniref:Ion transport domain-containing protein n=1 Tax=Staphylotrichum tortipilum TaxID=2831512 RepID=A0AAN6MEJ7_9PEZI|nr:hypothetical protein C8A05DRAFT_37329 [Staphylotrichum longicolle]
MLSALLRPFKGSSSQAQDHGDPEHDIAFRPSIAEYRRHLHATADFTEADDDDEEDEEESNNGEQSRYPRGSRPGEDDEDGLARAAGLLPLFSANQLDSIPIYSITHAIRILVQARTETTLSWDQLRSPQVSQFLIKPMLQLIRAQHFSPGTLYALLANCLQFEKEGHLDLGNAGTSATRARVCELLAIKLLKEYATRELIDALCYDFYPLQGVPGSPPTLGPGASRPLLPALRTSTLEVAIRASAKHFLSHPLVVQQLEAIWNGAINFSSRADAPQPQGSAASAIGSNPSRRQTVLGQRSSRITKLELLFWFWSAGFMLDELVGFNEQGFSFYVMSFWNIFDLGILMLLIVYYCMRIYGVFLLDPHKWNQNAYDVLALNAILLLPRVFGVLDHYRYFSRLLVSLRLLAIDLAGILVLLFICCGGFFVFFAFSKNADHPAALAYKMFQILVGYTPTAWEMWPAYNWMGQSLMGLFIVITHFIILTMLISVLTNSFASITSKASQEYQFAFAINTVSMAKNDALFSYIAPSNIFAWALMPLRYCMSLNYYVWLNRAVIKITHCPILFCIYLYEKFFLAPDMYEATDLVDKPRRGRQHGYPDPAGGSGFFSPSIRVREESVVGYHKDRALEEVFRRTPDTRTQRRHERRKTQTAIRSWMDKNDGTFNSPQNYSTIDSRLGSDWLRRLSANRERPSRVPRNYSEVRSTASDPADFISDMPHTMVAEMYNDGIARRDYAFEVKDNTDGDGDGDDELVTNDEDEGDDVTNTLDGRGGRAGEEAIDDDYYTTPIATRFAPTESSLGSPRPATSRRVPIHTRTLSTNTILYAPEDEMQPYSSSSASGLLTSRPFSRPLSTRHTPVATPTTRENTRDAFNTGRRSPRRSMYLATRPRSMIHPGGGLTLDIPPIPITKAPTRRRSLADLDQRRRNSNNSSNNNADPLGGGGPHSNSNSTDNTTTANAHMNKMMLAKMKSLEASLGDMVREMRTLRKSVPNTAHNSDEGPGRSWEQQQQAQQQRHREQQYQHHQHVRALAGSDPSSMVGGSQAFVEVAQHHYHRERERGGSGIRRARAATTAAVMPRRIGLVGGRRGGGGGAWRSPKGEGPAGAAGLGITGTGSSAAVRVGGKGKERERERERVGQSPGGAGQAMSPEGLGVSGQGVSL